MSTDNVIRIRPEVRSSGVELLTSAASLLRVGISAFGERGEPQDDTDLDDILAVVCTVKERAEAWFNAYTETQNYGGTRLYDVLNVLAVVEATIVSGLVLSTNGITISPIRGSMKVAAELIARLIEEVEGGPEHGESTELESTASVD